MALELPKILDKPTNESVAAKIIEMGYDLNPMKGISGTYYKDNRYDDLISLAQECLAEFTK